MIKNKNKKIKKFEIDASLKINNNEEEKKNEEKEKNENISRKSRRTFLKENNLKYENSLNGFINMGNTCYMNSFLQIIIHIPNLITTLKKNEKYFENNSLCKILIEVAEEPNKHNLKRIKQKMGYIEKAYSSNIQEDSQEFGVNLINSLINEEFEYNLFEKWSLPEYTYEVRNKSLIKNKNAIIEFIDNYEDFQNETFLQKNFQFYESECKFNKYREISIINYNPEIDNQLSLELNYKDKNDILELKELLINKYYKSNRKIFKLPNIFIITILRAVIGKNSLNDSIVEFEDELDLKEFMDKDFGEYKESTKYYLYSINMSTGKYKFSGHYYSYIKINGIWYKFNDLSVNKEDPSFLKKDKFGSFYQSKDVYGLFYIRKKYN